MNDKVDKGDDAYESDERRSNLYSIQSIPNKDRGIVATVPIPPFTLVHTAPCLYFSMEDYDLYLQHTILSQYLFHTPGHGGYLLALGHGSLFNHDSNKPNIVYTIDVAKLEIRFSTSYRKVEPGDELCIHYGRDLWFNEESATEKHEHHDDVMDGGQAQHDGSIATFLQQMDL